MADLETSLVKWLNNNKLSIKCQNISDLSDGILLYELMNKASPDFFDMECISLETKNNWALKLGNLRRLKKALDKYLEEELKLSNSKFDRIDLPSLARKSQPEDVVKLFEIVFYAILNCPSKSVYINRITELDETAQYHLMIFIQNFMRDPEDAPMQDNELFRKEHEILKADKRKLSKQVQELEQELTSASEENMRLSESIQVLKDENERLYQDVSRKSMQEERISAAFLTELKVRLNEKEEAMTEMRKSVDRLKKQYENEISNLKDEIDILNSKILQLSSADKTLQQYKKRLEDLAGVKQKSDDLQKQNENLMETVKSHLEQIEQLSGLKKQITLLKEHLGKEKNRAETLTFSVETKDKIIKKYERELIENKQKISILESKNQELLQDFQESSQNSEDSPTLQDKKPLTLINFPENLGQRKSCLPTSHEQIELAMKELNNQKSVTEKKKEKIKAYKERVKMCLEEMGSKTYHFLGIISQLEQNNMILTDQIQVINESLAEKENDQVVQEQTIYELQEVKAAKSGLLNDLKSLNLEKENLQKELARSKEEITQSQALLSSKDMGIKELELDVKVLKEKIHAAEEREKVFNIEISNLRSDPSCSTEPKALMEAERQNIAFKSEISELTQRLLDQQDRFSRLKKTKEEIIENLKKEIIENQAKFQIELESKEKELMLQLEEAMNELHKQREQLAAKLQFERRNTMIGWQRALSIKDPTMLVSEEVFKLREALLEKEKEIARVSKNNKELKMCWKDSAKLLKAVWKQLGDETKKIEDAVKRRHH